MPKLRVLSSGEIIKTFESFGFEVTDQTGSHVKMCRRTILQKQILIVPRNKSLPKGTIKALYNQSGKYISREELQTFFYTK